MAGKDRNDIPQLGTKGGKKGPAPSLASAQKAPPKLIDIPSLRVRVKQHNRDIVLFNIPNTESGVGLVLHLIGTYPDGWGMTREEQPYIRFGDIVRVECPKEGWLDTGEARNEPSAPPGSYRHIRVRTGKCRSAPQASTASANFIHPDVRKSLPRDLKTPDLPRVTPPDDELIGIVNIPESAVGRKIMEEIFHEQCGDDLRAYTLFTTDFGCLPVKELARVNLPPH